MLIKISEYLKVLWDWTTSTLKEDLEKKRTTAGESGQGLVQKQAANGTEENEKETEVIKQNHCAI